MQFPFILDLMTSINLTIEEVRRRLTLYEDEKMTDELYDFGKLLLAEATDRVAKLDTKAGSLAAYAMGIITFLVASSGSWSKLVRKPLGVPLPVYAAVVAFIATIYAVRSLRLQQFDWFSQEEWLEASCLTDLERMRKYRILTMWTVLESHRQVHDSKSALLAKAQWALVGASILLVFALVDAAGVF
jgi:hypothetical protein